VVLLLFELDTVTILNIIPKCTHSWHQPHSALQVKKSFLSKSLPLRKRFIN